MVRCTSCRKRSRETRSLSWQIRRWTWRTSSRAYTSDLEDEFKGLYFTTEDSSKTLIEPPYPPKVLMRLVTQNNILGQCVEAMEVNVDGTGYEFVAKEEGKPVDPKEAQILKSFFSEPYPGVSFLDMRRQLRRDMESAGYGYLEVIRAVDGNIVALRNQTAHMVRLVRLDNAVQVQKKIERNGAEVELTLFERERRFCIRINNQNVYYREFGTTRHLHKKTGEWEGSAQADGKKLVIEPGDRATELMMFGIHKDVDTAYSIPRWINQMPSVVGSRKAEEANLEFFDAGGIPPAIIFIQGGTLAKDMADQLKMYLSGASKSNNRAVVVEAQSSSGSLESAGSVQVKVERFGSERANDSMFSKYDVAAEEHVRTGFRLPPLFVGKAADYNFATAKTAYMVAEAQIFEPERKKFDEKLNRTLIPALGVKATVIKSNPITLKDVEQQFKAMELVADKVKGEGLVNEVNKVAGLTLEYDAEAEQRSIDLAEREAEAKMNPVGVVNPAPNTPAKPAQGAGADVVDLDEQRQRRQANTAKGVMKLAREYAIATGSLVQKQEMPEDYKAEVVAKVDALEGEENDLFLTCLSAILAGKNDSEVGSLFCTHDH
ncbi:portal protein [Stenotrophomonas phage vB_SmaS_DLP_3]|nr:portal protein [Stenotrophomonas phage vB_SmaS_DLP_3]